jgi:hypothetical protein
MNVTSTVEPGASDHRPIAPTARVLEARDAYLAENGFSAAEYGAPTFRLKLFGRPFDLRNGASRQWAIPLHDLHHVATGYGTDFIGEAEIGAYELAAGCRTFIVYWLNSVAVLIGLFLSPLRVLAGFRAGLRARALYRLDVPYEELLALDVGALRRLLGLPEGGLAEHPRRLHAAAPSPSSER